MRVEGGGGEEGGEGGGCGKDDGRGGGTMTTEDLLQPNQLVKDRWKVVS